MTFASASSKLWQPRPAGGAWRAARRSNTSVRRWDATIHATIRALGAGLLVATFSALAASPAAADFRLCNNTGSRVGVAIGYKEGETWSTEGWWNLSSRSCETILRGPLVARFYYVYAVDYDRGGEWSGKAFMCSRDKEFTIRGIDDCLARGHERTGYFEVDTGEQRAWTVQLTESTEQAPARPLQPYTPSAPESGATRRGPPGAEGAQGGGTTR